MAAELLDIYARRAARTGHAFTLDTDGLRRFDARDPLRYDFALAHLGISGRCPRRRVPAVCAECPIRRICCLPGPHESD